MSRALVASIASIVAGVVLVVLGLSVGLLLLVTKSMASTATSPSGLQGLRAGSVPAQYVQWVERGGALCPSAVGPAAIAAQIDAESAWNPNARSNAGAEGISQFMPTTWPGWAADDDGTGNVSPFNPADAIMAQGRYMCSLATTVAGYVREGRAQGAVLDLALAAYNAGANAVLSAHGVPHNGQTEIYVARIDQLISTYAAPAAPESSAYTLGLAIVAAAQREIGTPYVWGGGDVDGPTKGGFDCSGLVMFALFQASHGAITIEHLADAQARQGQLVVGPAVGSQIDLTLLQPGDIVGFADPGANTYHHVGIYAGNGEMIDAPDSGSSVRAEPLVGWRAQTWVVRRFG